MIFGVRLSLPQAGVSGAAPELVHSGLHPQHRPHASDVQHPEHLRLDWPSHPNCRGPPVLQRHHSAETGWLAGCGRWIKFSHWRQLGKQKLQSIKVFQIIFSIECECRIKQTPAFKICFIVNVTCLFFFFCALE